MKKKIAATLALFVLTASVMACTKSGEPANSGQPAGSKGSASPGAGGTPEASLKKDLAKIVVLKRNYGYQKNTDTEKKVHDVIGQKTGADVQMSFVPGDQIQNKINLMLASKEQVDIIPELGMDRATELYKSGAVIGLKQLIDKVAPDLKKNINPKLWDYVTVDGEIIGIPSDNAITAPFVLQIRKDWLKNLNMQQPVTIEDYEKVLDAFVNSDPDQNGKKDTFGLVTTDSFTDLEPIFLNSFLKQGYGPFLDANGKLNPPEMDPAFKDYLAKMQDWYKKGYIWKDFVTAKRDQAKEIVAQNKAGSIVGWYSVLIDGMNKLAEAVPGASYEPIIVQGPGINKLFSLSPLSSVTVITKLSKNPEEALKVLAYHATDEGRQTIMYGIEGESYKKNADGTLEFIGEDKSDWQKASYYGGYYIYDIVYNKNPFPLNSATHKLYKSYFDRLQKLPAFDPVDALVKYDQTAWKSNSKLNDLNTYLKEQKMKVITGELPVSDWDKIMQKWLEIGGKDYIEDRTAQYNQQMKK